LYRTGDQVRWRADGNLEFLGRLDHQGKLRGFRIEPGEIETALTGQPHVTRSVVLLREDRPGDQRLVAYVVLRESATERTVSDLRQSLQEKLPEYMVPSAFVILDALPLTSNGKVDRKALPVPVADRSDLEEEYAAPRTPVEELLAGIWQDVLGVDHVGIHDNFFELGGHSLLATRLVSSVRRAFHVELPLRIIFETPTIEDLALNVLEKQANESRLDGVEDLLSDLESISEENAERRLRSEKPPVEDT
jgi:acyl carrier protein